MTNINEINNAAVNGSLFSVVSSLSDEELATVAQTMSSMNNGRIEAFFAVREELLRRQKAIVQAEHTSYINK